MAVNALSKVANAAGGDVSDDVLTVRANVKVSGRSLPDTVEALLVRVVVDCDRRLPDMFELTFLDETLTVLEDAGIEVGSKVEIADGKNGDVLIIGEVTSLEAECVETIVYTTARGYDRSHRLQGVRRSRTWTDRSDTQIAEDIAKAAGLKIGRVDNSGFTHPHLGQVAQTDWEFLQHRAEEIGFEATVVRGEFSFRDIAGGRRPGVPRMPAERVEVAFKEDLVEFHPSVSGTGLPTSFDVRVWDIDSGKVVVGRAQVKTGTVDLEDTDPAFLAKNFVGRPPIKLGAHRMTSPQPSTLKQGDDSGTYVVSGLPVAHGPQAQELADRLAAATATEVTGSFAEATGLVVGNPAVVPGAKLVVRKVAKVFAGAWTITNARHVFDESSGGYYTHFTASGTQDRSLYGLVSGASSDLATKITGVVSGIVHAIDPENRGRVKVLLPWLSPDYVTDWARTVHPGLGAKGGVRFLPEKDDEVLVAFEQGDPRRPYVLGGVHTEVLPTAAAPKPVVQRGKIDQVVERGIYSPSGAHLVFEDDVPAAMKGPPKQAVVRLGGKNDQVAVILDQRNGLVEIKSAPAKGDSVATAGHIRISCGPNGSVDIVTSGTGKVNVDAGTGSVTVHGGDLTLKGDKSVKIESSGPVAIKGLKIDLN